ncbi:WG repeat-containing protein [Bradyrhizobium sp.]|uniref:WG repeat-containing protein n=1 Tax=Bradyrhizobium sp. TaxID=376 RepID=UPI00345BEF2E
MAPVEPFDNSPDAFRDGLARSRVGQKIGYIDRGLTQVIPARYDGAYPFEGGHAVVCLRCSPVSDGEHSWYEGGEWGCIDRRGREVKSFVPWRKDQSLYSRCRSPEGR